MTTLTLEQEKNMVQAMQQGDRKAATLFYETFSLQLFRSVILARLPYVDQAEDVLCETFRIALEKIHTYTVIDRSIFFWLRRIAINLVIDTYRKQAQKRELAEKILVQDAVDMVIATENKEPDADIDAEDNKKMVEKSLERLQPRYAQALRLRLIEDKSREECATLMDVTVATFDVLLHRACKAFRDNYPP